MIMVVVLKITMMVEVINFSKLNSIGKPRATGLSAARLPGASFVEQS